MCPDVVRTDVQCEVSDHLDMCPDCVFSPKEAEPALVHPRSARGHFVGARVQGGQERLLHSGRHARSEGWECRMLSRSLRRRQIGQRRH